MKNVLSFVTTEATAQDLDAIVEAIRFRREKLDKVAKYTLKSGQNVKFTARGVQYEGKILSIRVKKATVQCTSPLVANYVVPLNMLQAA
ncbi:hypothetical protein UFOVP247_188 [uncultured Caudovirales phage]|uniref:Uncharacterized protein n=1 Tax=uncultured Caudovirales phage TaxID=2100421 RepID=A0A6J7WUU4_9CAUD|nr:hypothetical protein UFOVP247_188 [uncultured Caudovirales phage]